MHNIKYFFSIKIIRQFRGAKKNSRGGQIIENITEKYYFLKFKGDSCPWFQLDPPLSISDIKSPKFIW
jgi:hypothetical protein